MKEKTMAKTKTKKAPKAAKTAKKISVDWGDEDSVKRAMAKELDIDLEQDELDDFEEDAGYGSFRAGTVYKFSVGRNEYAVAENDGAAHELAVAIVKQDLEESPENFEQNFIQSHINLDRLRRDLHSDVWDSNYERLKEEAERRPMEFLKDNDIDIPEPTHDQMSDYAEKVSDDENPAVDIYKKLQAMGDAEDRWIEMGEEPEVPEKEIDKIAESETESQLKDPVSYLDDIYGDEAIKKAIEIGGIDEDAAAEEAVSTDGAGHFLSGYDGNLHDGPGGIVYWRTH